MYPEIRRFHQRIQNKSIALVGIGVSNTPLMSYLLRHGAKVSAFDKNNSPKLDIIKKEFESQGVSFYLGEEYLSHLHDFDIVFRTPGIRPDTEAFIRAKTNGSEITSEMEEFLNICPARMFGVTGSDGKTTTTTLIYEMLKKQGYTVWLGGNIGSPLLHRVDEMKPDDIVVLELSSFQLMHVKNSPQTAVITNISPNHLDYHLSMDEYIQSKKNIFLHQNTMDRLVVNFDNEITRNFESFALGNIIGFARQSKMSRGVYLDKENIIVNIDGNTQTLFSVDDIRLPGRHNVENYMAAIAAVWGIVEPQNMQYIAKHFQGVEHRLELVREFEGVRYYNDSIASSPSRTIAGLLSFDQKVILIAGGCDKKIPYDDLGDIIIDKVSELILIGQTANKIEAAYEKALQQRKEVGRIPIQRPATYKEAVQMAYETAKQEDIVVLSPASTSFDMFHNFEERGKVFKDFVHKLPYKSET